MKSKTQYQGVTDVEMKDKKVDSDMQSTDVEMTDVPSNLTPHIERKNSEGKRKRRASDDLESPEVKKIKTVDDRTSEEQKSDEATAEEPSSPSYINKSDPPATIESDYELLCDFYPQYDSDIIWEKLNEYNDTNNRVHKVAKIIEKEYGYPKWEYKRLPRVQKAILDEMLDFNKNFDDLVNAYEALAEEYNNTSKDVSEGYQYHMKAQLEYDFPRLRTNFILSVARSHNFHYLPTYKELLALSPERCLAESRRLRKFSDGKPDYPVDFDHGHSFFKELLFLQNEEKIRAYTEILREQRTSRFNELKSQGLLETCACCCNDETLPEDLLGCPEGHMFCKTCIGQSTEVIVGQARGKVPCLNGDCEAHYTLPVIKKCVTVKIFSLLADRFQQEELQAACIENLLICKFCDYALIIEDPDLIVFTCLNPLCRLETCRLCNEPNHVPLNCKEYKELKEVDIRLNIENEMSEAMVRSCYNCDKRFLRTTGCPVMTCVCGAQMCYICRGRRERGRNCGCGNVDSEELHKKEVEEAYKKAIEHYFKGESDAEKIISKLRIDKLLEAPSGEQPKEASQA